MGIGKGAYLKKLTSGMRWKTTDVGEKLEGTSPPSVFVGSFGYPKVLVGPMVTPVEGDTTILDTPEEWIPNGKQQEDILSYRMDLVRGKQQVGMTDFDNKLVQTLQEITLSAGSVDSEAEFKTKPKGFTFDSEHQPFGPSAPIEKFDIDPIRWNYRLEKAYYDTDLKASNAISELYKEGVLVSQIQKALSTGSMGLGKNRKLVPTRWSITAVDSSLSDHLYEQVVNNDLLDCYQVYEFSSLNNYYAIILTPTPWMYEWIEAFIHVMSSEELIFADHELTKGKSEYSSVGGCYYSCKFGILEALERMGKQAGAIVLREAYQGYVPLGVFNVRENVRNAMKQQHREFGSFRDALMYVSTNLRLPMSKFLDAGVLINEMLHYRQTTL